VGKTVAVMPTKVVVIRPVRWCDALERLTEIPHGTGLELCCGDGGGRSRHVNRHRTIHSAESPQPPGDPRRHIVDVAMAVGRKLDFALNDLHRVSIANGAPAVRQRPSCAEIPRLWWLPFLLFCGSATMAVVRTGGVLAAVIEALLPGVCPHCDQPLSGPDRGLCGACWSLMVPRAGCHCPRCGAPADDDCELCPLCLRAKPPQSATVIWGEHDGASRSAVVALKHGGRDDLAPPLGSRLAAAVAIAPWASEIDLVCHVPTHPWRRLKRPWEASALLAYEVALRLGKPRSALLRRRGLRRQTGRTRAQRLALDRHSFKASRRASGRNLLLVDDVTTTGTTLRRAAEAFLRVGAATVYCAVFAEAPDPRRLT
jgi:predicted amidophosphoribosyltransferase